MYLLIKGKSLTRASILALGLYFLLPTPDGVIIHPLFGSFLSCISGISIKQGIIISIATYTIIGIILCLIGGGRQICQKVKSGFTKRYKIREKVT